MFINNPTENDLQKWFKCNYILGEYLEKNKELLAIYKNRENYYFVKTKDLQQRLDTLPFYYRVARYL